MSEQLAAGMGVDLGLQGKVALVAGGGAANEGVGNGRAAALTFARAGARVFVGSRREP